MSRPEELVLVNMQSELAAPFMAAVADELARRTGLPIRFDDTGHWTERRERLLEGGADLGFWCGLPYALEADAEAPRVQLLAAPVMAASRYGDQPIYFSDVIVRQDAPFHTFADLAGATWAYNEPGSHSGYAIARYELARREAPAGFFGTIVEAGSHLAAIALIRAGRVDAAAIDSTVLELATAAEPGLTADLRVLETWGPAAMPPLLASTRVPAATRRVLTDALLTMHHHPAGRAALALGSASRFAPVRDQDYNPIRRMAALGERYALIPTCSQPIA